MASRWRRGREQTVTPAISFLEFLRRIDVVPEPAQRVFWAVAADGVQPKDLRAEDRELAVAMFGPIELVPEEARTTVAVVKGAEIGWSYFLGLRLLYRALTADVSNAAPGEIRTALAIAPD